MTHYHYTDPLDKYAESAWRRLELTPPADLTAVCKFLKIRIHKKQMDADVCGFYVVTPKGRRVIRINKLLDMVPARRRFTLAHEIGHHLMLPVDAAPGTVCELRQYNNPDTEEERRANRFAAAILMPHWIVRKWWEELSGNPDARVPIMASRFDVSLSAMRIRVNELKLENSRLQMKTFAMG